MKQSSNVLIRSVSRGRKPRERINEKKTLAISKSSASLCIYPLKSWKEFKTEFHFSLIKFRFELVRARQQQKSLKCQSHGLRGRNGREGGKPKICICLAHIKNIDQNYILCHTVICHKEEASLSSFVRRKKRSLLLISIID